MSFSTTTSKSETVWTASVDEEVSESITQTWTDQAIKCYVTQADCLNCSIPKGGYSFVCQMSKVIPVLLNNLGKPDNRRVSKLLPYMSQF
jgi:hypothetical protein